MNEIEKVFYNALEIIIEGKCILQKTNKRRKIIGVTCLQNYEDACIDCSMYIKIKYETYIDNAIKNKDSIDLYISSQERVEGYTIDFFLQSDVPNIYMGIEIDGHEWHEKTKEQASYDKKRERVLLSKGIPCIRYTGSDVYTNPEWCAKDAIDIYFNYFFEILLCTHENWKSYMEGEK